MKWSELAVVAAVLLLCALIVIVFVRVADDFQTECGRVGGTAIWDGRQYACLKR